MLKNIYGIPAVLAAAYFGVAANTAYAADLGGGCCADLEERVAELEATAARKGNRTVSLNVTGQVSRAIMIWDDGTNSDAYVVDNAINTSRFGFEGKAFIRPGVSAGYVMQIDINDSLSSIVSQFDPPGPAPGGDEGFGDVPQIRINSVYIESESLGKIAIGQNYSYNDAVSVPFQVANTFNTDGGPYADGMQLTTGAGNFAGFSWGQLIGNGPRRNDYVRYDSPSFGGFAVTALWGDDDVWDVGARFFNKIDRFQVQTAIDYFNYDAEPLGSAGGLAKFEELKGIFSVKDLPTGLFLTVWAGKRDYERNGLEDTGYSLQGFFGIEKNFTGYGNTTIYGGYGQFNDFASTGLLFDADGNGTTANDNAVVTDADVSRITFGMVQSIDSAGLDIYGIVEHFSADVTTTAGDADLEDYQAIVIGSRIRF